MISPTVPAITAAVVQEFAKVFQIRKPKEGLHYQAEAMEDITVEAGHDLQIWPILADNRDYVVIWPTSSFMHIT